MIECRNGVINTTMHINGSICKQFKWDCAIAHVYIEIDLDQNDGESLNQLNQLVKYNLAKMYRFTAVPLKCISQ